jgi:transposase
MKVMAQVMAQELSPDTKAIISVVMEPTGGYEQRFARFAIKHEWRVSLPNPYRVKLWAGAMGIRAKTDRHDARTLAHYGFNQDTHQWKPLPPDVEQLNFLLDRLDDQQKALRCEKNRLEKCHQHDSVPKAPKLH